MNRTEIIQKIEAGRKDIDLTIIRSARFKKHFFKSVYFYLLVAINRYTPFLIPIKARTLWKHELTAYETSAIGSIFFLGYYDREISLFLLKYFNEAGDILDIGANIGVYTSLFTQIAESDAKIIAFEPTPSTFLLLKNNVSKLRNVICEALAISDKNDKIAFYDYGYRHGVFNSSKAQIHEFLKNAGKLIEVETATLDDRCHKNNLKPSLIKLDTEGTEAKILSKASYVLATYKPLILLEVGGGEAWSQNNNDSLDIMSQYGYDFYTVNENGNLEQHVRQSSYTYTNLVAIHNSKRDIYVKKT